MTSMKCPLAGSYSLSNFACNICFIKSMKKSIVILGVGNELKLENCPHDEWNIHSCNTD